MDEFVRYRDLTQRLAIFSPAGWSHGDREDLLVVDGDEVMNSGEVEAARVTGHVIVVGPRSTEPSAEPRMGKVLDGAGLVVVTSERLIVELAAGSSQLGRVAADQIHTLVLPLRLMTTIAISAKKSIADRIMGARATELMSVDTATVLRIVPDKQVLVNGLSTTATDADVTQMLIDVAVADRLRRAPGVDEGRLRSLRVDTLPIEDGERVAWLVDDDAPMYAEVVNPTTGSHVIGLAGSGRDLVTPEPKEAPILRGSLLGSQQPPHLQSPADPQVEDTSGRGPESRVHEPGWFPDPLRRHEWRWWDGTAWTAQVASGGIGSTDPI